MHLKWRSICMHAAAAALVLLSSAAPAASFNYLYIEASEGNSSGGHAAIQFDDDIYHYQRLDSGLIRLFRQDKAGFHFLYRYLQNRPIHESRVEVTEETFDLLERQFKWQFLAQERQFGLLDDLRKDRTFIRHLLHRLTADDAWLDADASAILQLKGVGFFYPEPGLQPQPTDSKLAGQQALSLQDLRQKIEQRYGPGFLQRRREQIESQIKALAPIRWPAMGQEKFPAPVYSFADSYLDNLTALFAVKALAEAPPLRSDAFFLANQKAFHVSEAERQVLLDLRRQLETSLIKSIESNRPDWGYAALVNMARYIAVDTSLYSGYWTFIDDFAGRSERIGPDQYLEHGGQMRILLDDARAVLDRSLQAAVASRHLTEAGYGLIEMAANRYFELLKSEKHQAIRYDGEKTLPDKSVALPDAAIPELAPEQLTAALSALDNVERKLLQELKQDYGYDLITRNCVTELFRTLNQALSKSCCADDKPEDLETFTIKESEKRLGGYVAVPYNFIPFVSHRSVLNHYHVTRSRDLDSYRGLELSKLKAGQDNLMVSLRESNIFSSRLYRYNPDDALFVFFTDDNWLLRPVFGLFNTAAGIGQSVYGLFSWPLDSGKNLKSGATGILMSLPELAFFNMRKGSYKYLSFRQLSNTESSGD